MYKDRNVVMLPTEKASNILLEHNSLRYTNKDLSELKEELIALGVMFQHLYITSDEEIKEGDWYYDSIQNKILKCTEVDKMNLCHSDGYATPVNACKKIIATTDSSLTKLDCQKMMCEGDCCNIPLPQIPSL